MILQAIDTPPHPPTPDMLCLRASPKAKGGKSLSDGEGFRVGLYRQAKRVYKKFTFYLAKIYVPLENCCPLNP